MSKVTYRACIQNAQGTVIVALKGKHNTQEQLNAWLAEHWNAPFTWTLGTIEPWHNEVLELTVWRYAGLVTGKIWIKARKFSE